MKLTEKLTKKQTEMKQCNEPRRQAGANRRKEAGQDTETSQWEANLLETMEYLLKENSHLRCKLFDVQDNLEELQSNSKNLTDLIHISWEGIRTESVGSDEVKNAITSLYLLSDGITEQAKHIIQKAAITI